MTPFLQLVAEDLFTRYKTDISDVCLVFPGKRAGLFFSRHLSRLVDKPIWLPPLKTISELMADLSGLHIADPLILISQLFEVYQKIRKSDDTFDNFYSWGEILLNDFDDIDKYLVNTRQLFQNLSDIKEIESKFTLPEEQLNIIKEFWKNINIYEPGPYKEEFLSIWAQLHLIYSEFKDKLRPQCIAYEGMICRDVFDLIKSGKDINLPYKKYAIVGFNALNECEKAFFSYLDLNGMAHFYWDYDKFYIENTQHEAGFFIRENLKKYPQSLDKSKFDNLSKQKNIQIVSVPSGIGQAKLIPTMLENWGNTGADISNTAVILADEQLLIPVLSSIPENIEDVNVTLGYPFKLTPVHSFLESVISLQRNKKLHKNSVRFYHRDITTILNHPYVQNICGEETKQLLKSIIQNNRVFLSEKDLHVNEYFELLFQSLENGRDFAQYLLQAGSFIANKLSLISENGHERNFHLEYWFTFLTSLNRLIEVLKSGNIEVGLPVIFKIIRKMASGLTVSFKGEPLSGFQVMGVLETRTLDFENVIVLSANEGILPKSEASVSYIPYNLRKGFGLPTIEHQDAIYAYYFYRLIQRANKIDLVYNSQSANTTGEMSRFLYQIKYEPLFTPKETGLNFTISLPDEKEILIHKNKEIQAALLRYSSLESGLYLTPTALSSYMDCSLRFYFRYIVKIEEKEEVLEDVDGSMFGKLLHYAMLTLYKPFVNKTLTSLDVEQILKDNSIEQAVMLAFRKEYLKNEFSTEELHGKNLIINEVLKRYIREILSKDKRNVPYIIKALERRYKTVIPIGASGAEHGISIGGIFDRLDEQGSMLRIIDYKTGMVELSAASIDQLFDRTANTKKTSAIFQALLYSLILSKQPEFQNFRIMPGIYALRKIFNNEFDIHLTIGKSNIEDLSLVEEEFSAQLKILLEELFDSNIPFTKVEDKTKCEYCAYRLICHR